MKQNIYLEYNIILTWSLTKQILDRKVTLFSTNMIYRKSIRYPFFNIWLNIVCPNRMMMMTMIQLLGLRLTPCTKHMEERWCWGFIRRNSFPQKELLYQAGQEQNTVWLSLSKYPQHPLLMQVHTTRYHLGEIWTWFGSIS